MTDILISTETWLWLALIALIALIVWKGLKPITAGLDAKAEKIRQTIDEAENLRADAEKTLAEYKRKQRDALSEAEHIVEHAKSEAKQMADQQMKELEVSLARREQQAMDKIAQAEAAALRSVKDHAVDAAIAATSSLIQQKLSGEKAGAMIDDSIREVSQRLN